MIPAQRVINSLEAQDFIDRDEGFFKEVEVARRKQIKEGYR